MLWTKEVEMVDSVDEFKSSRSIAGKGLDARIASASNKIIQNSHFKKKVSLQEHKAQKEDRFLRGRQIAYMIYDYFRVTGAHDTVRDYTDFFSVTLRNDTVEDFGTSWDEILLSMIKMPSDDFWKVCRSKGFPRTRLAESSCACDCGRRPVSVGAFFFSFFLSFFFLSIYLSFFLSFSSFFLFFLLSSFLVLAQGFCVLFHCQFAKSGRTTRGTRASG